ncbi:MAG: DUF4062 domain-containing protein, partial [Anaerovorax sp.]|nr:DUF4062 domain-containing protein [Anaerovorax sp.]
MKSIFVSSTFKDMQAERDMLHMEVMPRLQEKARNYGERISFIDLRWGVDTGDMDSEAGAKKVLSVCLDEIDRCRPYMLIFLGERYGWIPESRLIENAIAEKGFSVEDIEESVTALEIEYGVFSSKEAVERCIFCIREPLPFNEMPHEIQKDYIAESSIHKSKLEALKKRIKQLHGAEIITYRAEWHKNKVCGLEVLSEQLYALFIKMFEKEWLKKSDLSWQDRELMEFQLFMEEKRSCFVGRQSLIDHYYNLINDTQYKAFILQGEEGSGKSSMLSMLTERLIQKNYIVFPFICGNSGKSDDLDDMIKQMVYFLETHLELSHLGEENQGKSNKTITREKWRERFFELCESYGKTKKRPFAFVIDALEQLKEQDEAGSFSWIPPFFSQNIIFIVSFKNDFKANLFHEDVLIQEDFCVQELELLQDSNKKELIKGILAANHKGLDEIVVDALVNKKSSDNPMYLSMLLTRLMMMDREDFLEADRMGGGGEGLDALMISIIEQAPEELQEMSAALIQEAARRCSPKQAQETLYLLAASRRGLREEDLEAIILSSNKVWNTVDFSRLLRYMQSYFVIREDGCVDFTYPMTRKGLLKDVTMKIDEYQNRIFNYIKTLPEGDTLRTSEALYYARLADDKTFALSFLDTLVYANPEIKEIGKSAIIELIKDEGSSWFTEVCLLSHTLNRYCEQFLYDYLVHDVLAQPVWGINEGNRLIVSCSVLEGILENVFSLIDNFDDPCFYFKEEDIYLATRDVDAYLNVVQLIIHSIWHIVENYIEFLQHKRAMTLLNTLVNFMEEVKEKVY